MISHEDRFRISEQIRKKWGPIADTYGIPSVPIESRTVLLVSSRRAVIENGGFEYLLEQSWQGDEELEHAIAAFNRIGCLEAADLIGYVVSHFQLQPGALSDKSTVRISALHSAIPAEMRDWLDRRFFQQHDEVESKLAEYVLANKVEIENQLNTHFTPSAT